MLPSQWSLLWSTYVKLYCPPPYTLYLWFIFLQNIYWFLTCHKIYFLIFHCLFPFQKECRFYNGKYCLTGSNINICRLKNQKILISIWHRISRVTLDKSFDHSEPLCSHVEMRRLDLKSMAQLLLFMLITWGYFWQDYYNSAGLMCWLSEILHI